MNLAKASAETEIENEEAAVFAGSLLENLKQ
jgi:hypothetical protein